MDRCSKDSKSGIGGCSRILSARHDRCSPRSGPCWRQLEKRQLLSVLLPILLPDLRLQKGEHMLVIKLFLLHLFVRLVPKVGNTSRPAIFGAIPLFLPYLLSPQFKLGNVSKPKKRAKPYPVKFSRDYTSGLPVCGQKYTGSKMSSGTVQKR
jgi:hypothetical protein